MNISEKIKELRNAKGIKQSDLASLTGLSQGAISQFEKGVRQPTPIAIKKIATALEVEESEILGESAGINVLFRNVKGMSETDIEKVNAFAEFIKSQKK